MDRVGRLPWGGKHNVRGALIGAACALAGVALVELLVAAGLQPLGPVGWPGVGVVAGTAFGGLTGLAGGLAIALAYYLANLAEPQRFVQFYSSPFMAQLWAIGLLLVCTVVLLLRGRLVQQQALRASEARFRRLAELSSDWYWEQNEDFRFTFVSREVLQKTGTAADEYLGKTRWQLPADNLNELDWARHRAQLERHEPFRELLIRRPDRDGRAHWMSITGEPIFDAAGGFRGYRGVGHDVTLQKLAEDALRESEVRFRSLTELTSDFYWEQDENLRFVTRVGSASEKHSYPEHMVLGKTRWELPTLNLSQADWARHRADLEARREFRDLVLLRPSLSGEARYVSTSGRPFFDAHGQFKGYRGVGRDVTARMKAEQALRDSERRQRITAERLALALEASNVVLWDTDLRSGQIYLSEGWAALLGGRSGETLTSVDEMMTLVHPEDIELVRRASHETLKGLCREYSVEHRVRSVAGDWKWILSRGRVIERDPLSGRAQRMIGTNVDITQRRSSEESMRRMAQFDALTQVANRALFHDRLRRALLRSRRRGGLLALVYLDIDRFKSVNDSFGHAAGDALLKELGARLSRCVRETDTVGRLGGDEFGLFLEDLRAPSDALAVADKILAAVREPVDADGTVLAASVSMGIAFTRGGELDGDALLKRADTALYQAKDAGRDNYRVAT